MTRHLLYIVLLLVFPGTILFSQQELPASIEADTLLSRAGSPYLVNQPLLIAPGATLTVEAGVTVMVAGNTGIRNEGRLLISGTEELPVLFTAAAEDQRWNYIYNTGSFIASHLLIRRATRFVSSYGDTVIIDHCNIDDTYGTTGDDCIGVHDAAKVLIRHSSLTGNPQSGKTDAIDLDGISGDTITGNTITGFSDDGIDIGTQSSNIVITHNVISHCEMAISIGESTTATVTHNLLTHSASGIQSHTGASVRALQNTLYGNNMALRAYHYPHETTSGGAIHITNAIIAATNGNEVGQMDNSEVIIEYCLSDSTLHPGTGNLTGDPGFTGTPFTGATPNDFRLTATSPAIDAGDPDRDRDGIAWPSDPDDRDPDGTRTDLGCFPFYQSALTIRELSPSNLSVITDDSSDYDDWILLHNSSATAFNLKDHAISDNPVDPLKHRFTTDLLILPGDTLRLWADDEPDAGPTHLSFKLSGEGEQVLLSDPAGNRMAHVTFPRIPVNWFYRKPPAGGSWQYCTLTATGDTLKHTLAPSRTLFSFNGGQTTFPVTTTLSAENSTSDIFYTNGNTNPATPYTTPLTINGPSVLRAMSSGQDQVPGYTHARNFYAEGTYSLPVVALTADHEDLYGEEAGICENYSRAGPLWERPVSYSFYDGSEQHSGIAGIRIQGGNSVWMPKKSFRLHFRGGYGASRMDFSPFAGGPPTFRNIVLRAGYDDDISQYGGTLLRDPFTAELWKALGELATESTFRVLLLNNEYQGIYNVRESINADFVEDKMGIRDFDLIRFQKWGPQVKNGTWDAWNRLNHFFETTDFTQDAAYDALEARMDMHSMLNLLSLVHCSQFRSWTWGAFMIKPEGGKWSWTIWDTDRSYNSLSWNGFTEYANTTNEKWPNIFPQKMIRNRRFREALINRTCDLLNTLFIPENAIAVYDSLVGVLTPEMDAEYARWNPGSREQWDVNNERIREFLRNRPAAVYQQMKDYFELSDTARLAVRITGNGTVRVNALEIAQETWSGIYMEGVPVVLEAVPHRGATFTGWDNGNTGHRITIDPAETNTITAVFDTAAYEDQEPLVINEIMYHPLFAGQSEWIELYNPNSYGISLEGYGLTDGGTGNWFEFPQGEVIDPEGYFVVTGELNSFLAEFGMQLPVTGSFNGGVTGFNLGNGGEPLILKDADGETEDRVDYSDDYPWPYLADGYGPSLQLLDPALDNSDPANWMADADLFSTPGRKNGTSTGSGRVTAAVTPFEYRVYPNPAGQVLYVELPGGSNERSAAVLPDGSNSTTTVGPPGGSKSTTTMGPSGGNKGPTAMEQSARNSGTYTVELITLSGRTVAEKVLWGSSGSSTHAWHHGIKAPGAYIFRVRGNTAGNIPVSKSQLVIISGR